MAVLAGAVGVAGCGPDSIPPLATAEPGVVFTYPADGQLDVPVGARIVVVFSNPVASGALGAVSLEGPAGPVAAIAEVTPDGRGVHFPSSTLDPGTTYRLVVGQAAEPAARNLPASGPLVTFTTRSARLRAAGPTLIAVNGADPAEPTRHRPMFDTSTIRLVFSEPLDPRSVVMGPGAVELVDAATRTAVPATLISNGIHIAIDPVDDLTAGASYEVRVGAALIDLGGQPVAAQTIVLTPEDTRGVGTIPQVLRMRQDGDPGPAATRTGAERNVIVIDKPIIGREVSSLLPAALAAELGDPKVLGGPIAFTIRRGQRMRATGLDVKLGGQIPTGLSTGDIWIELITDGGGRIYRNPHQPADQRPENERSPLYVDLSLDVAVYAVDPDGNAVLTQTVLGVQSTGIVAATDGVLAIESVAAMELGLLGVTTAPTNFVLELITDEAATADVDQTPPSVVATSPALGTAEHDVDAGIEVIFDEPVDLDALRAGGLRLENGASQVVPSVIESHGAAVVIRPLATLAYGTIYRVVFGDVRDLAGNALATTPPLSFTTPQVVNTSVPLTVTSVYPGVACALNNGRCAGGRNNDDVYHPFTLPANQPVEITFSQSPTRSTIVHGTACNTGTVRIEQLDVGGACMDAVPGTLVRRDRSLSFVPDQPWIDGVRYRLTMVSGGNDACNAGEMCGGPSGDAASFDPLNGTEGGDGGGPNLVIDFAGAPASEGTFLAAAAGPSTDVNGSGFLEGGEVPRDENRAAMRIVGTSGAVSNASFNGNDCVPGTPEKEACMYISGAMPVIMGELSTTCPLPGGATAPSCIPVTMTPQPMFGTSVSMRASVGISINSDTGTSMLRVREPAGGPVVGYVIDDGGVPTLVVALDLYMDAPDMSIPLSSHDLHSKPLAAVLRGPMTFKSDGRIVIEASNTADLPVSVAIDAPLGISGAVNMIVPANEMKLTLISPSSRGVRR